MKHADNLKCRGEFEGVQAVMGGYLVKALRCPSCLETHFDPAQAQLVLAFHKYKDREFTATVTTSGPSTAIRVDKEVARAFGLERGEPLSLRVASPTTIEISLPDDVAPAPGVARHGSAAPVRKRGRFRGRPAIRSR